MQLTPSAGSALQRLRKIVQFQASRQRWSAIFPTSESVSQMLIITLNTNEQKKRVTQSLASFKSARKHCVCEK